MKGSRNLGKSVTRNQNVTFLLNGQRLADINVCVPL
jgi:hypothetical protein